VCSASLLSGATNARTMSSYVDFLFNSAISNFTETHVGYWTFGPPLARCVDEVLCLLTFFTVHVVTS